MMYLLLVWWGKWWVVSQSICVNHFQHVDCPQQQVRLCEENRYYKGQSQTADALLAWPVPLPYFRDSDCLQSSKVRWKIFILLFWLLLFKRPWKWQDCQGSSVFTESFAVIVSLDNIPMHVGMHAQKLQGNNPLSLTHSQKNTGFFFPFLQRHEIQGLFTPFWA